MNSSYTEADVQIDLQVQPDRPDLVWVCVTRMTDGYAYEARVVSRPLARTEMEDRRDYYRGIGYIVHMND